MTSTVLGILCHSSFLLQLVLFGFGLTGGTALLGVSHGVLVERNGEEADDTLVTVILGLEGSDELRVRLEFDQVIES